MFSSLAIIVVLSFIIPFIAVRITGGLIPSVALELVAGLLIGKSGLNIVNTHSPTMEFLSTFGLIYLMFLGGMETEFDVNEIKSRDFLHSPLFIALLIFILTLVFSYLFSLFLIHTFNCAKDVFYLTLIFSTTSVAIVFPTLKARTYIKKSYKQTITTAALVADFATLFMIGAFTVIKEKNSSIFDMVIILSLFVVAFLIKRIAHIAMQKGWIVRTIDMLKHKPHIQMGIRASFAILFIFLFLAEKLGIEIILGSFIAGILTSRISKTESELLLFKLDAIGYGFFIPFFFIYQGAKSQLPILSPEGLLFITIIIIGSFLIKIMASTPMLMRFSPRETLAAGFLLSGRLSLIIAASIIGLKLGIIDNQMNSAIILLAAISCIIAPSMFSLIEKKRFDIKGKRIIVVGGGSIGASIAKHLSEKGNRVTLIEKDKKRCQELRKICSAEVYCAEATSESIWERIAPSSSDTALLVTNSDEVNLKVGELLKEKYSLQKVFARDNNPQNRDLFKSKGITPLIYTETLIKTIEDAIEKPITFELLSGTEKVISEAVIHKLSGKKIADSELEPSIEIVLIKRGNRWIRPDKNTVLRSGDVIVYIADKKDMAILKDTDF